MKNINSKLKLLNIAIIAITASIAFSGCKKEMDIKTPGNLVPKTVDQDPSLPSISVNGTQLHAEAFGNPSDPMVVFLHGGPGDDYRNAMNVKQLTENGYYVVFYDQRGSGLSKRHDKNSYSIQIMLDDLTAVIDHYRTSSNQKIFLLGHSWGAMLSAAYINTYPSRISGVILAEPGGLTDEMIKEYAEASRKIDLFSEASSDALYSDQFLTGKENEHEILDYKLELTSSFEYSKGNAEGVEGPSPFWRFGAVIMNSLLEIADKSGFDFTANLKQFMPKVLFLYSENNKAYGISWAQKQAAYFNDVDLEEIHGTGHEMIYFKWNNVYPLVLNYLNSLR